MDKAGFATWLGEDLGGTTLSENTKRALVAGFAEGVITSSNVLDDTHVLDGQEMKDMVELWCAFYEDACKGALATASQFTRGHTWSMPTKSL